MDKAPRGASSKTSGISEVTRGEIVTERFPCRFLDCNKSFIRREHLVRHAQSHHDLARHVCRVCLREFSRNDSLQRHLMRHGDSFKPSPSARSKRACVVCRTSKVKCDGKRECSRCIKRNIECVYNQENDTDQALLNVSRDGLDSGPPDAILTQPADGGGLHRSPVRSDQGQASTEVNLIPPQPPKSGPGIPGRSRIEWFLATRVEKDTTSASSRFEDDQPPAFSDHLIKKYTEAYFVHFHCRWPAFHSPTYEADGPTVLCSSILMIGSWLSNSQASKEVAIEMHGRLTDLILLWLHQISSSDIFQESLPANLCQAALLNIIFGLQCGRETALSKAAILRSALVAALRTVGFFTPEIPFDKPNVFAAFRQTRTEERKRIAAYLFKIDSYIGLIRCEPPVLMPEELYFSIPSTFALFNGLGLHVWEVRESIEPEIRAKNTIRDLIQNVEPDATTPEDGLMLIEDIQLGLCGLQSSIWHLSDQLRRNLDTGSTTQRSRIRARLESWKRLLLRLPFSQSDSVDFGLDKHMAMRFYYGFEDHSEPGWQASIFARPKGLFFDALMLYHLISIHLHADIRILKQITNDISRADSFKIYGSPYEKERINRECGAIGWTQTKYARRAVCHAAAVLSLYKRLPEPENKMVDPIAFVALSVSSLVVWAYCTFGDVGCDLCRGETRELNELDLIKWAEARDGDVLAQEMETWVEGGVGRLALDGVEMCRCNMEEAISKFQNCMPEGWQLSRYEIGLA